MGELEMNPQEKAMADEALRRGVLTDQQIRECLQVRDQMRKLGLEADLTKALIDKKYVTKEQLRTLTAHTVTGNCFRHPDRAAVSRCDRCGRPLCADCVIRVGAMTLCGETCAGPVEKRPSLLSGVRASSWLRVGAVAGGGIVLTVLLWFLASYLIGRADYRAYKELIAQRGRGGAGEEAIPLLEKVVSRCPGHTEAHVDLAREYRRAGHAERGARLLAAFLERKPRQRAAMLELASCHEAAGSYPAARRQMEEIVQLWPDDAGAARGLAELMVERFPDEGEEMERAIRASLRLRPQDRLLRYHLARICRREGLAAEAAKEIETVLQPPGPGTETAQVLSGSLGSDIYLLAAELKLDEGKHASGIPLLKESLRCNPLNARAGALLARAYTRDGQAEKAKDLLSDLARRSPADPTVWEAKAGLDLSLGDLDGYADDLTSLYALKPDDTAVAARLFEARVNMGDVRNAAVVLNDLSSRGHPRMTEFRARLALEEGKLEEAKKLLQELAPADLKDPSVTVMFARMERASGRPTGAVRLLSDLVNSGRGSPGLLATARIHLGLALWQTGDARAAASEFGNVVAGECAERTSRTADRLLRLADGEIPQECAVRKIAAIVERSFDPARAPRGLLGLAQLAWVKGSLAAAAFGGGGRTVGFGNAGGKVPSRGKQEGKREYLERCVREAVRSELTVARILASEDGITAPESLSRASELESGGAVKAAMCLALEAELDVICQLVERHGMKPGAEFLRRKGKALAAVQESSEAKAVATAYVVAEALAAALSAGEAGWAYEGAAQRVVDSLYAGDKQCQDAHEQMLNAERAHVLLLNVLALRRRDARLIVGP